MESYSINLIIATYGGKYGIEKKENYLKKNLQIINIFNPNITQITILKPKINNNHKEIIGYYDFNDINLSNIKNKIKIYDCENIGISYGQYFIGISKDKIFDYYILIEDDYTIFDSVFEKEFIKEFKKYEVDSLLCSFIYKNRNWDIIEYSKNINENINNINLLSDKLIKYDMQNIKCNIPDFSLCLLSKYTVEKIFNKFGSIEHIIDIFNINLEKIWLHQIIFGYILNASGVNINDITNTHLNIFYHTENNKISICNFENYVSNWKQRHYQGEKLKNPLFIPIQMLNTSIYLNDINDMKKYLHDENKFIEKLNQLNLLNNLTIRKIEFDDYNKGYIELMYEFTNFKYSISKEDFIKYINTNNSKILIIFSENEKRIIGAGTIFKIEKLHNNPIGQIEDIIISQNYRNMGLGKTIIEKLIEIGKNEFKCYKIILNCLEKNIGFYEKCGFINVGVEMKLI
jgi:glucosamine-phosphate N-acetyltransferase